VLGNWPATKRARHPSDNGIGDAPFEHCLYDERGAGEAGTGGAPAAIMNAVNDALRPLGAKVTRQPITPEVVLRALGRVR